MTTISRHMDWLSFTVSNTHPELSKFIPGDWMRTGKGLHGYRDLYQHSQTGARAMVNASRDDMGSSIQLSGDTLSQLRMDVYEDDKSIVNALYRMGGHTSRVDLAINIHNGTFTPKYLHSKLMSGKTAHAQAKQTRYISGKNGDITGDTLYIGGRTSERFLRCYDKRSEQHYATDKDAWIRLELEVKGMLARTTGLAINEHGSDSVCVGMIGQFLSCQHEDYKLAISGTSVLPDESGKQISNTEKWLIETVAKAFAKVVYLNPDFFGTWYRVVELETENLRANDVSTKF